ncbi:hypothetical protein WN944_023010 [Citrus x changshan-huyou]|uniref:Uncharacterized protein n=1 Tax=Citrus x changshan-huyou TaxID=2935761 RepID=A0AAP0MZL6_9ROSI
MAEPTEQSGATDTGPRNHETGESSQSIPPDSQAPLPIYNKGLAWIRKHEPMKPLLLIPFLKYNPV